MDGIIAIDEQQHILLFNGAAEKMFGRTAEEMLGRPIDILLPERFRPSHARHVEAFGQSSVTRRAMGNLGAVYGIRADGEQFPIEAAISQARVDGRNIFTVILRDITERLRIEEALHASTTLVNSIVESSHDAIIGKTLDGTIISWNAGAAELFGYSAAEAMGRPLLMLFPPERIAEESEILARIARGERVDLLETERIRKDGRRITVSITTSPLRDSFGKIVGASKIARDITEQKRERERVLRLSRIQSVLSSINALIVRSSDRGLLLDSACQIAVERGGFGAAWIGMLDENSGDLRTAAWSGLDIAGLAGDQQALTDCASHRRKACCLQQRSCLRSQGVDDRTHAGRPRSRFPVARRPSTPRQAEGHRSDAAVRPRARGHRRERAEAPDRDRRRYLLRSGAHRAGGAVASHGVSGSADRTR
jgi:PAS domain S-box-containing protein